jgi:hypothetical protein
MLTWLPEQRGRIFGGRSGLSQPHLLEAENATWADVIECFKIFRQNLVKMGVLNQNSALV